MQVIPTLVKKVQHLLEIKSARRTNMLVGPTGTGKTTAWHCAESVMHRLHDLYPDNPAYNKVRPGAPPPSAHAWPLNTANPCWRNFSPSI